MTPDYDIGTVVHRMKNLQRFEISKQLPDTFEFRGQAPYDFKIQHEEITVTVWAVDLEEAVTRVNDFVESWS
jgi:hypothetical protein